MCTFHFFYLEPGLGYASICPDECAYDTNNSRIPPSPSLCPYLHCLAQKQVTSWACPKARELGEGAGLQ